MSAAAAAAAGAGRGVEGGGWRSGVSWLDASRFGKDQTGREEQKVWFTTTRLDG